MSLYRCERAAAHCGIGSKYMADCKLCRVARFGSDCNCPSCYDYRRLIVQRWGKSGPWLSQSQVDGAEGVKLTGAPLYPALSYDGKTWEPVL